MWPTTIWRLGQIVDALSHSAIWKDTAIFVTEDDPQSGVDHVDAHRSILLVMSPYVRKGFISHRHSSMGSIQKTIYQLLGLGPLNLEDALASDLSDMFTTEPNLEPYTALPTDPASLTRRVPALPGRKQPRRRRIWQTSTTARKSARIFKRRRLLPPVKQPRAPLRNDMHRRHSSLAVLALAVEVVAQVVRADLSGRVVNPACAWSSEPHGGLKVS